jgi:hypothetical protein
MASILFKWFFPLFMLSAGMKDSYHPIYVSVTEIEHNAKEKTLEISCKIFTEDLEQTLRNIYQKKVDLINPTDRPGMDRLINDYVQKHLKINIDGKSVQFKYLGFELIEEAIYSYYEVPAINSIKRVDISNNILYEYSKEQMGLMHVIVNGDRKSTKLLYPDAQATINF